ncbi:MAG: helix-turn-helix domain-containing protein [Pseudonocardiaceae bacterium]
MPLEFWDTDQFREAFAAQHMGWVARAYRTHPHHHAVYGPGGISQTLLGQWIGLRQPHVSRFETGPSTHHLDTLRHWARMLHIPPELLWFDLPGEKRQRLAATEPAAPSLLTPASNGVLALPAEQSNGAPPALRPAPEYPDDPVHDPILAAPWNHRGTVEAVVVLSGGGRRVKRRAFVLLTGPALTAPAHQWLVHESESLVSGLSGQRISAGLVDRLPAMIAELRVMDDVAGGGEVLALAQYHFGWVAGLLDQASYDDATGRKLHVALAEIGQFIGWVCYDTGRPGLAQRYYIAGLRAAHTADDRLLGAHILGSMANQAACQGYPAEAVTLIESAVAGTRGRQTPRLLTELHIRKAYAFAALKDTTACNAAIARARTHVEQPLTDDDPPYLYWVRPAEITAGAGYALLQLGQADRAVGLIEQGITLFDSPFDRDRQIYLTYLIEALACPGKQRDLEAAAIKGVGAIHLAESLSSTRSVERLRDLYRQLKPHDKIPAVREFLERVEGIGKGKAN